jgi:hypothetical protein
MLNIKDIYIFQSSNAHTTPEFKNGGCWKLRLSRKSSKSCRGRFLSKNQLFGIVKGHVTHELDRENFSRIQNE